MAHSKSAIKRIRQNEERRARNRWRKRRIKGAVRAFEEAVHGGDQGKAGEAFRVVTKALDQVASTGTIHKKAASRRKSRLAARLNEMATAKS